MPSMQNKMISHLILLPNATSPTAHFYVLQQLTDRREYEASLHV